MSYLDFFGQQEKFGQSKFLKKFTSMCACCFLYLLFYTKVSMEKSVKLTPDSDCLAHDEIPFIFKRDHSLIYMYVFSTLLLLGTGLHCTK